MRKIIDYEDIVGNRYGDIIVLSYDGYKETQRKGRTSLQKTHYYTYKCTLCGTENKVSRRNVMNTKSCLPCHNLKYKINIDLEKAQSMRDAGYSLSEIAKKMNVSKEIVQKNTVNPHKTEVIGIYKQ